VDVKPSFTAFALGNHAGTVADETVDQSDLGAVGRTLDAIGKGHIPGHENVCLETGRGGVGGQGASRISGGRGSQLFQTVRLGHGHGGGQTARFERAGRIQAFVFDVDAGKFPAEQHGCEPLAQRYRPGIWQRFGVAPHGWGASQQ